MEYLLNGVCQGIVLTAVVGILLRITPSLNAATRYAVWWVALIAVVVLPFRPLLIGRASVMTLPSLAETPAREALQSTLVAAMAQPQVELHVQGENVAAPIESVNRASISAADAANDWLPIHVRVGLVSTIIIAIWMVASLWLLIRLINSGKSLRQLKYGASDATAELTARLNIMRDSAGVRRHARLLVSDEVSAPMALGLFDPVVLIPRCLSDQLSDSTFDHIALHELAHLRRYDDWTNLLQKLMEALLPVQPALFWIGRQMVLERETACDDWVLAVTGTPKPYAASLTRVAELTHWARCGVLANGAGGHPSQLYRRVHRLLDQGRNVAPRIAALPLMLALAAITIFVSASALVPRVFAFAPTESAAVSDSGAADQSTPSETQTKSFAVQPGESLVVDVDRGDVRVGTWDQNTARIVVTRKGPDLAEFVKHHRITMSRENGEVRVHAEADGDLTSRFVRMEVRYDITVPRRFNSNTKCATGSSTVAELEGKVDATTETGSISLRKIDGPANVRIATGSLSVDELREKLDAETITGSMALNKVDGPVVGRIASGDAKVTNCAGKLMIDIGTGSIHLERFTGPTVHAQTATGAISADFHSVIKADCLLKVGTGSVAVQLSPTVALDLKATTSMGSIHSTPPIQVVREQFGGSLDGALNGGGPTLQVEVGMGDIQIREQ